MRRLRALFAFASVQFALWVIPAALQASCGDWLAGHEDVSPARRGTEDQADTPAPSNAPCQAPGCRDLPAPMPTAPDRSASFDQDERSCNLSAFLNVPASDRGSHRVEDTPALEQGSPLRVERPPRA